MWSGKVELNTKDPPESQDVLVWVSAPGQTGHWEMDCMIHGKWSIMELLNYTVHGWTEKPPVPDKYKLK